MSTNISQNTLRAFLSETIGRRLTQSKAAELGIDQNTYNDADIDLDGTLSIEEIIDDIDSDIYEQFATLYVQEQEKKQETKDKEQEKEEQNRVTSKNEAKA